MGFLLPLHRHSETSYSGFRLNENSTYLVDSKAVLRTAVEVILCYGTRKLRVFWRGEGGERKNTMWIFLVYFVV